ncbi:unnamed protein product [Nezara viridula]|uniref:Alpha-galactosidase n=1 Tax=Nezara viridula TaxID=85310 RepID=A0A9P0H3H2_NEZVI|nr:unnamed protein product [Nezara viridula]
MIKTIISMVALFFDIVHGLDNGLALTPPMGWNTWERFRCTIDCELCPNECISERLIKRTCDLMVSGGYLEAGYEYIVIDDCWSAKMRDKDGNLQPNNTRFPKGILDLSRYLHSRGMKFGIYANLGTKTCAGYPGTITDIYKDADLFASWEVDFVKLDGCYSEVHEKEIGYPAFGMYLNATGRPIVYSCSWPAYLEDEAIEPDYEALKKYCNLWRNYADIEDSWTSLCDIMNFFANNQDTVAIHAGPGHWNDPDMLIIGNFGLSYEQAKVQMAIWAILAAPLFISTDFETIRPEFAQILLNKDVIEINQDKLGIQGRRIYKKKNLEVWRKPVLPCYMGYHSYAVAVVSKRIDGMPFYLTRTLKDLGLYNPNGYMIKDLFFGIIKNMTCGNVRMKINPTGVVFLKFTSVEMNMKNEKIRSAPTSCTEDIFFVQ